MPRQAVGIARSIDEAACPVDDLLGGTETRRGDDRQTECHRFENDPRIAFETGAEDEEIRGEISLGDACRFLFRARFVDHVNADELLASDRFQPPSYPVGIVCL